jgi:uncharacterized protein YndB with AHSA1/START domain
VAPIVSSVEIDRSPADVFAYVTDPAHLSEWQESVVGSRVVSSSPEGTGTRVAITRRVGPLEREMTAELADLDPPRHWIVRGIDGPVRGNVNGTIEPVSDEEARSRVTIELELSGHGLGKLIVPLIARPQVRKELPRNMQRLKERLETGG